MTSAPAVVTPLDDHMGLDIARSLARRGVTVYGIDSHPRMAGRYAKACRSVQSPAPEDNGGADYLQFLVEFGKTLDRKAVLFPLSDRHVLLCSENRSALRDCYEFVMPEHDALEKLTTKDGLEMLARRHAIPAPRTFFPGEDSRLVYISFYLDRDAKPLAVFAGRKHRVIPPGFGSASYACSYYAAELEQAALKVLSATNYRGLGGIEFKRDPRDEEYKLIEVNTRFGMWDGLGVKCGVDLPYIAYCDALRLPVEPQAGYRTGVKWIDWQRDVRAAVTYWRQGQITPGQWLGSLRGEKVWAIYSKDDWRPGVVFTLTLIGRMLDRLTALVITRDLSRPESLCDQA